MKSAKFYGDGLVGDSIFDLNHRNNRDNCFEPYVFLQKLLLTRGYELHTEDMCRQTKTEFELHFNAQKSHQAPAYLLCMETPNVYPLNSNVSILKKYRKIFTWNDALIDGQRFIKINFPNPLRVADFIPFAGRSLLCCMIAGNKSPALETESDLYMERIRSIRWFENNAAAHFHLYGVGWDGPTYKRGLIAAAHRRLHQWIPDLAGRKRYPSFKGPIDSKASVLQYTKFALCYENVKGLQGYITEKIFDCFLSGCVPVYWGAINVGDYIPSECFVDRRNFRDTKELYDFLCSVTGARYQKYQDSIRDYLNSDRPYPFGSEFFANTIVNTILDDLGHEE